MPPRGSSNPPLRLFCRSYVCLGSPSIRCLSTTSTSLASIRPESPQYIRVPQSLQPDSIPTPPLKGILPVPRQVFARPESHNKVTPAYLAATTPKPKPKRPSSAPKPGTHRSWEASMAASRRRNLREGLTELLQRKKTAEQVRAAQTSRRQREHERLVAMPIREDERLTSPTILTSQLPSRIQITDPDRSERVAHGRANAAAHEARRIENRRDDLHTLYMNAGEFITDRQQALALIEKAFDDVEQFQNGSSQGENVWHTGYPKTVAERLRGEDLTNEEIKQERMRRIAETLTGGKMRKP